MKLGDGDATRNTLRLIQAANQCLDRHKSRLSLGGAEQAARLEPRKTPPFRAGCGNSGPENKDCTNPVCPIREKAHLESSSSPGDAVNRLDLAQEKLDQLELKVSRILEYSSKLEQTLQKRLDSAQVTTETDCSCRHRTRLNEDRIISIIKQVISSTNRARPSRTLPKTAPKTTPNPRPRPGPSPTLSSLHLESIARQLLDSCLDDTVNSLDLVLQKTSQKVIKYCATTAVSNLIQSPQTPPL